MRERAPLGVDLLFTTLMGEIMSATRDTDSAIGRGVITDLGVVGWSVS